jgi:hypothetical protein
MIFVGCAVATSRSMAACIFSGVGAQIGRSAVAMLVS